MKKYYKGIVLGLIILVSGCIGDSNSLEKNNKKKIIKNNKTLEVKSKIISQTKKIIKDNRYINNATNLLSVEISGSVIKLFFNKKLISNNTSIENVTDPIFSVVYYIAEENKINNPEVKIYIDGKSLDKIVKERENFMKKNKVFSNYTTQGN